MRDFITVLSFELTNYFKNKSYIVSTLVIALLLIVGLSLPNFINIPGINEKKDSNIEGSIEENDKDIDNYVIYDKNNVIPSVDVFESSIENSKFTTTDNEDDLIDLVKSEDVKAGFIVNSLTDYKYVVNNTSFSDNTQYIFEELLSKMYINNEINLLGYDLEKVDSIYNTEIKSDVEVLGKDSVKNMVYTYILIFIVYMMVVLYGQLIAVAVTAEKSNRSIEVLVTSTSSNCLIFGKVLAGSIASIVQAGIILISGILTYSINKEAWGENLDFIFDIPSEVLVIFAVFGILGFILYSFIYGVLGALVSKAEDVNKSATPITFILIAVFLLNYYSLFDSDGILIKILSYIPFSSCFSMFVRVAMGNVQLYEIIISLVILLLTIGIIGVVGAKIYRMGTLNMGNPIKLKNAIKSIRK